MIQLIVGRAESGKAVFRAQLKQAGVKFPLVSTTCPQPDGTHSYRCVTDQQADAEIESGQALNLDEVNGYRQYVRKQDLLQADAYVCYPSDVDELTAQMPDTAFIVLYIQANAHSRKQYAILTAEQPDVAAAQFDEREQQECRSYDAFEHILHVGEEPYPLTGVPQNLTDVFTINNDISVKDAFGEAVCETLIRRTFHENMYNIIHLCCAYDFRDDVYLDEKTDRVHNAFKNETISADILAMILSEDPAQAFPFFWGCLKRPLRIEYLIDEDKVFGRKKLSSDGS